MRRRTENVSLNEVSAGRALRSTLIAILMSCVTGPLPLIAQSTNDASAIADQAITSARAGNTREALSLYEKALSVAPDKMEILRDYAIVLGWAGRYSEAIPVIKKVRGMENNQPDWALREFASIYLFGDRTEEALHQYNALVERGDVSEQTLNRRALSLRWLGRRDDALIAYSELLLRYPKSVAGVVGIAYAKADKGQLSAALHDLESNENVPPDNPEILKARIRILNWMGRHYEAQKLIAALPGPLADDREILEDRIAAARWGGDPNGAMQDLGRLSQLFPGSQSERMSRELRTEYGQSFSPYISFAKDSDGLMDRKAGGDAYFHLNPSYSIHIGYQYRWQEQQQSIRTLLQYNLGLAGNIHPRVSFYSTVGSVDYRMAGAGRKYIGDASLTVAASDRLRISGGGGSVAMDAYQSLPNRVTAPFGFGDVSFNLNSKMKLQARYSRFSFSDGVLRDRADSQVGQSVVRRAHLKLIAGWRFNWMRNSTSTSDFWSPLRFQSNVAFAQGEGRITSWMDYFGELAGGWQSELGSPIQHPFQVAGRIAIHPNRHWRTILEAGKSTSSLDRALPGQRNYSRWVASATMEFRFP